MFLGVLTPNLKTAVAIVELPRTSSDGRLQSGSKGKTKQIPIKVNTL